ncbi:hypothetical protein [Leucothrix arctica]|uniref:Uncharacterized protein n=1 Tax=Leucothrix arctica TaxID=1481894 RepID=A0A317C9Z9_9GAMM|nr:hypothetical protein [Leucothrix arctica]PWQ95209.1 hypothetical protein DKT75_12745 [Leucothrix arctica]
MNRETEELKVYLNKVAMKSLNGEIPWTQLNSSVFQWIQGVTGESFKVTVQRTVSSSSSLSRTLEKTRMTNNSFLKEEDMGLGSIYLFQVQDRRTKTISLSLSSLERPEFFELLAKIYHGAEKGLDVRATSILKRLLGQ